MIIRQRAGSRSDSDSGEYTPVNLDDDDDFEDPVLIQQDIYKDRHSSKTWYSAFCFAFSLFGASFLFCIGHMLRGDSLYLKVSEGSPPKLELSVAVMRAAAMYAVCALVAAMYIYRGRAADKKKHKK